MAINWFPGHMHKARKEIAEIMPQVDVIIEILDARIPFSSENPLVPKLRGDTPVLKVLNKSDLADPIQTARWLEHLEQERGITAIAITQHDPKGIKDLLNVISDMVPHRVSQDKQLRALICGIPNVGKSTTINILADRIIAKTGNEAGVTKAQQRIRLDNNIVLHDTPGFLWPKLEPQDCGYRLAITGGIKDTVTEKEDIAYYLIEYLMEYYPQLLMDRFQFDEMPQQPIDVMDLIAKNRACMRKGGIADLYKVSEIVINEYRGGVFGPITLETVELGLAAKVIMEEKEAEREANKEKEEELKKKKRRRR
ncbi:ribosome biogenesis GTPase YlqF [Psychrosphaera sp. B3R10]|uniref:ribosome biogenesis GTPase YlqF n=1 Tax=unclassified Psychrosphaera TaxID=2641570 RepID=UPI001C09F796|nr:MULTISPECIES: ribosome biogenesis GTPase YlqF [unclassified Psychrosphaera]MBU2883504.1 ribosome biogenesis GTPase YlqF [Psychrosphaera sp. I2R16]MBU2989683.1 ribosome biogenesis GTPase YlqF [Psychrosphaera sp. B3R10]MDO6719876.1 ribosome biogenesis GTPase YlqF [Psychrosphaera sp. 1_MG-2023]